MSTSAPTGRLLRQVKGGRVTLAHGGGGSAMRDLVEDVFIRVFEPSSLEDQARLMDPRFADQGAQIAFTTDGFVVDPIEFPGGDIGRISVCGTVNDLAVGGAEPLWLSAAFVIEEGCDIALLRRIVASMDHVARQAGVRIVTGDTKVVEKGSADKVFITTSGVGLIPPGRDLRAETIRAGDQLIVNGPIGDHGAAVLAARDDLALATDIQSDCQPLNGLMQAALEAAPTIRACRDATRGGLAATLNEMAEAAGVGIEIDESALPVRPSVQGICEILGLDPLYLANEGTLALFVSEAEAEAALAAMRRTPAGRDAKLIGRATADNAGTVIMTTRFGGGRIVDMPFGEQLPRIC